LLQLGLNLGPSGWRYLAQQLTQIAAALYFGLEINAIVPVAIAGGRVHLAAAVRAPSFATVYHGGLNS
jgi:hypothetical protein